MTLSGSATSVRTSPAGESAFPVDVLALPADSVAADAAVAAVRSERVWATAADRHVRLFLRGRPIDSAPAPTVRASWIADAIAMVMRDDELQAAATEVDATLDAGFDQRPWIVITVGRGGRPLVSASESAAGLTIVSAADPTSVITPLLVRSVANALSPAPELRGAEIMPIPDAQLRSWQRPAGPVRTLRLDTLEQDDRRWFWALVIGLLALETFVRRARPEAAGEEQERARVA